MNAWGEPVVAVVGIGGLMLFVDLDIGYRFVLNESVSNAFGISTPYFGGQLEEST